MTDEIRDRVRGITHESPGISLSELFERTSEFATKDDIFTLMAEDSICANLHTASLVEPDTVHVFDEPAAAAEYERLERCAPHVSARIELRPGASFKWDSRVLLILNVGDNNIGVKAENNEVLEIPISSFEKLVLEGRVSSNGDVAPEPRKEVLEILNHASPQDRAVADDRIRIVKKYLDGEDDEETRKRAVRDWVANYKNALAAFGDGYLGLIPQAWRRGNRLPKLPDGTVELLRKYLEHYQDLRQPTIYLTWCDFRKECINKGTRPASYSVFSEYIRGLPLYDKVRRRRGARAAYKYELFFYYLDQDTPRHGDRPFEIGHIDHTELDEELCESLGLRRLAKAWITTLVDACTRRALAFCLTYDPPSKLSCMMVLRECVRRHGRLPQIIVVDGGKEFSSIYFETLLARYEVWKKTRVGKPRGGSVCERLFGTTNTQLLAGLRGNTQIMKSVRLVTKANDPKRLAVWTLPALSCALDYYFYETYDTLVHPALGESPRDAFNRLLRAHGERKHRFISYNQEFLIDTLPTTPKGTATVQAAGRGVKINYIYYFAPELNDSRLIGKEVPVRFDPLDCGHAYVYVRNTWVECKSEYFGILRGHSLKEIELIVAELKERHRYSRRSYFSINADKIAAMIESNDLTEAILLQRQKDLELQWAQARNIPDLTGPTEMVTVGAATCSSSNGTGFSFDDVVKSIPDNEEDED
jgi:putative transposase